VPIQSPVHSRNIGLPSLQLEIKRNVPSSWIGEKERCVIGRVWPGATRGVDFNWADIKSWRLLKILWRKETDGQARRALASEGKMEVVKKDAGEQVVLVGIATVARSQSQPRRYRCNYSHGGLRTRQLLWICNCENCFIPIHALIQSQLRRSLQQFLQVNLPACTSQLLLCANRPDRDPSILVLCLAQYEPHCRPLFALRLWMGATSQSFYDRFLTGPNCIVQVVCRRRQRPELSWDAVRSNEDTKHNRYQLWRSRRHSLRSPRTMSSPSGSRFWRASWYGCPAKDISIQKFKCRMDKLPSIKSSDQWKDFPKRWWAWWDTGIFLGWYGGYFHRCFAEYTQTLAEYVRRISTVVGQNQETAPLACIRSWDQLAWWAKVEWIRINEHKSCPVRRNCRSDSRW